MATGCTPREHPATAAEIAALGSLAESCSRQLRAWADSLQNSDIPGPRHLTEKTRASYEKGVARKQGATEFKALLAIVKS